MTYRIEAFGERFELESETEACCFKQEVEQLRCCCQSGAKVKYLLNRPGFTVCFGGDSPGVQVIGNAMIQYTFGPVFGGVGRKARDFMLSHAEIVEEHLRPEAGVEQFFAPYCCIIFDEETRKEWDGRLLKLLDEAERVRVLFEEDKKIARRRKKKENKGRWKQVRVLSQYIPPNEKSGDDGYIDATFSNGDCCMRMIQLFVFDKGRKEPPARFFIGTDTKGREKEEQDLIEWLKKYGPFTGYGVGK